MKHSVCLGGYKCNVLLFVGLLMPMMSLGGSRINPQSDEGVRPVTYRTGVYLDQNLPMPITGSGDLTIDQSGWYALSNKIVGTININSNYVKLDCNGYEIDGGIVIDGDYVTLDLQNGWVHNTSQDGIKIEAGRHDIMIMNGTVGPVTGTPGRGIYVDGSDGSHCYNIIIRDMHIIDFAVSGIMMQYTDQVNIERCTLTATSDEINRLSGITLGYITKAVVSECTIKGLENQFVPKDITGNICLGFYIVEGQDIYMYQCKAMNITGSGATVTGAYGFTIYFAARIMLEQCIAENITGSDESYGIFLEFCNQSIIKDCICNGISANKARGIELEEITDTACIGNLVGNADDDGIFWDGENSSTDIIAKNIVYQCAPNYDGVPTETIQTGYTGSNFMYNVSL